MFGRPHASATFWSSAFSLSVRAGHAGVSACTTIIIYTICQVLCAPDRLNDLLYLFAELYKTPAIRDAVGARSRGEAIRFVMLRWRRYNTGAVLIQFSAASLQDAAVSTVFIVFIQHSLTI